MEWATQGRLYQRMSKCLDWFDSFLALFTIVDEACNVLWETMLVETSTKFLDSHEYTQAISGARRVDWNQALQMKFGYKRRRDDVLKLWWASFKNELST